MTDRLKVSLFDMLSAYGFGGVCVLDLFAGTGSLGIEMLSRGAAWADFVEQNATVVRIIQDNLATTRLSDRARVYTMPVGRFLTMKGSGMGQAASSADPSLKTQKSRTKDVIHKTEQPDPSKLDSNPEYDIILLDPPYADPAIEDTLQAIALSPILAADGLVVIGHANRVKLAEEYGSGRIKRVRHRAMGDSAFSIYSSEPDEINEVEPDIDIEQP